MAYTQNNTLVTKPLFSLENQKQIDFIKSIDDNYTFNIRSFTDWLEATGQCICYESIRGYFEALNTSQYSASTINLKRQAVKKRIKQLHDQGKFNVEEALKIDRALSQLDRDPKTKARKINTRQIGREKILSAFEYQLLLDNARSDRQRMFMKFLMSTGCRVSELVNIRMQHCKPAGKYISIRLLGKGSKERYIKIQPELFEEVQRVFNSRTWLFGTSNDKSYSRNYVSGQITKLGKHVLNRQISAHTFRHSFITNKIGSTGKIKAVSVYVGHSSVKTTMDLYVHEELSDDELFE